MTKTYK